MEMPNELKTAILVSFVFIVAIVISAIAPRLIARWNLRRKCTAFGLHRGMNPTYYIGEWHGARVVIERKQVKNRSRGTLRTLTKTTLRMYMDVGELPLKSYQELAASSQAWLGDKASIGCYQDERHVYDMFATDGMLDRRGLFFQKSFRVGYKSEIHVSLENMYAFREEIRRQCLPGT